MNEISFCQLLNICVIRRMPNKTIINKAKYFSDDVIARVFPEASYRRLLLSHLIICNSNIGKRKLARVVISILVFLFGINNFAQAQNMELQKSYADSLFQSENFFDAITEYKRLLFFSDSTDNNFEANYRIALCYKGGAKYDDAIKFFNIAEINSKNSQDSIAIELQIIRTNILRRTIPEALLLLSKFNEKYSSKIDSTTINYWRGWAYLMADDWKSASKEFAKININHTLKLLADSTYSKKYSVAFAKISSFIIPGVGQCYTGNYLSGIMSLGWNVLWGYLTINAFITDRAVEGILMGGLLWARFYKGNFQNAEKFAVERNKEISNKAYGYLAKKYDGEKP